MTLYVKDFTIAPGPGLEKDGLFSGQIYRDEYVRPRFKALIDAFKADAFHDEQFEIILDGAYGYSYQWLEEVFGGMIVYSTLQEADIFNKVAIIISDEEPWMLETISNILTDSMNLMLEVEEKKKTKALQKATTEKEESPSLISMIAAFMGIRK